MKISHSTVLACSILLLLFVTGCTRIVPLTQGVTLEPSSTPKIKGKILVIMDSASAHKIIVFKPGPMSDKFSLTGGDSIRSNIINFVESRFETVAFAYDFASQNQRYDYFLEIIWKDFKIDMGKTIFSKTKANQYIDYHLLNADKKLLFSSITDGQAIKGLSGGAIATAINPFVFVGARKAEQLIANAWNESLANSLSQFAYDLETNSEKLP